MKKNGTIRLDIQVHEGSILEKTLHQVLVDIELNRKRLKESFSKKKEKQLKKVERRRL